MRYDWTKLHASTLTSSLWWKQDAVVLKVFLYFLLASDAKGALTGIEEALAMQANVEIDEFRRCLAILTAPDPDSQTKKDEGRRIIVERPGVYQVTNKETYNPDPTAAARQRKHRELAVTAGHDSHDRGEEKRAEKRVGRKSFVPPTLEEVSSYIKAKSLHVVPERFMEYFEATEWVKANGKPVVSWKGTLLTWEAMGSGRGAPASKAEILEKSLSQADIDAMQDAAREGR